MSQVSAEQVKTNVDKINKGIANKIWHERADIFDAYGYLVVGVFSAVAMSVFAILYQIVGNLMVEADLLAEARSGVSNGVNWLPVPIGVIAVALMVYVGTKNVKFQRAKAKASRIEHLKTLNNAAEIHSSSAARGPITVTVDDSGKYPKLVMLSEQKTPA